MNQDHIYFDIDKKNTIRFDLQTKLSDVFRYVEIKVVLCLEKKDTIILFDDFLIVGLRELQSGLEQILSGDLILHSSITQDIGYLWNEYLHDVELPSETNSEGYSFWVGQKYLIWNGIQSKSATWLYEKDGKFLLEVTPGYRWHFPDSEEDKPLLSYEEFMKIYKPIALFEVSRGTLEDWLKKVNEFIPVVEANDSKYFIKQN